VATGSRGLPTNVRRPVEEPVRSIIVKLAARCNLACDYCYWFRDQSVMAAPRLLGPEVEQAFLARLETHLRRHALDSFTVVLHGGEPLLFGKLRFAELCVRLREVEAATATRLDVQVTTNGVLVDAEWAALLRHFGVSVTVSIDGPAALHDRHRPDLRGRPTHARVLAGIERLRALGIEPGFLAVAAPTSSPALLLAHLCGELGVRQLDVLIPDATHADTPGPIAPFFTGLFDSWYDDWSQRGVELRMFSAIIRGLCGYWSGVESIGYGPVAGMTLLTDGSLEAHDVCRIAGDGSTASALDVRTHELDDIRGDPLWRELWRASLELPATCEACPWRHSCGGGHIASRWSAERRFDNPSVYCGDLQALLAHVWRRIEPTLTYEVALAQ
jgi:uncharacterized protein